MEKFNFGLVSSLIKNLPNYLVIALLIVGGLFAYKEFRGFAASFGIDLKEIKDARFDEQQRRLDELNRKYLQLSDNIARAQTNVVSQKEIEEAFARTIDSRIQEIVKKNKEQVVALGNAIAHLGRNLQFNVKANGEFEFVSPAGKGITIENTYVYADSQDGQRGIRLAQVVFDFSDTTFTYDTDPLKIKATSVRTEQPTGDFNHYVEFEAYNFSDSLYRAKPYRLKVDTVVVLERRMEENRWFFPEPHLEGGLASNTFLNKPTIGFDVGVSLVAYGRTAHDNSLRFARVGIGFTDEAEKAFGSFSPIGVNVRTIGVPFLKDTWIFPGVSVRKGGAIGLSASLSTTF